MKTKIFYSTMLCLAIAVFSGWAGLARGQSTAVVLPDGDVQSIGWQPIPLYNVIAFPDGNGIECLNENDNFSGEVTMQDPAAIGFYTRVDLQFIARKSAEGGNTRGVVADILINGILQGSKVVTASLTGSYAAYHVGWNLAGVPGSQMNTLQVWFRTTGSNPLQPPENGRTVLIDYLKATLTMTSSCTPPSLFCPPDIYTGTDNGTCDALVSFAANATGMPAPVISYAVDGLPVQSPYLFQKGTTLVSVSATNGCSPSAGCVFSVTVYDDEAPVIYCPADIYANTDPGACGAIVNYEVTSSDNCPDAVLFQVEGLPGGSEFPIGTTVNSFIITDAEGQSSTGSFLVTVTDHENPQINCPGDMLLANDPGVCGAVFQYEVFTADNCPGPFLTQTSGLPGGSVFFPGTTTNTFIVSDASGNTITRSFDVTVIDEEAPLALCMPASVTLSGGLATITPDDIDAGSTDNCYIYERSLSNSTFGPEDIGENLVTFTVRDDAGNTASCTATVTVFGSQPVCTITAIPFAGAFTGGPPETIYLGYGPQSVTLAASVTGVSNYSLSWNGLSSSSTSLLSCTTCAAPVFTPQAEGRYTYSLTVDCGNGCITTCSITLCVFDIRVPGTNGNKVYLCHAPPGNPGNSKTISVSVNAVPAHIPGHAADKLGICSKTCENLGVKSDEEPGELISSGAGSFETLVFPNPSSAAFTVTVETESKEIIGLTLFDLSGKVMIEMKDIVTNVPVEIGNALAGGFYILQIRQGTGVQNLKIIKRR